MQNIEPISEYYWQYVCVGVLVRMEDQGRRDHQDRENQPRGHSLVGMSSAFKKLGHTVKDATGSVRKPNSKKEKHRLQNEDLSPQIDDWVRW